MPPEFSTPRPTASIRDSIPALGRIRRPRPPHLLLGVAKSVDDPVEVICAAHLRLRRLRLGMLAGARGSAMRRARRITKARESLLARIAASRPAVVAGPRDS